MLLVHPDDSRQTVDVSAAAGIIADLLEKAAASDEVALLTADAEISPEDAAAILGISRPLVRRRMDIGVRSGGSVWDGRFRPGVDPSHRSSAPCKALQGLRPPWCALLDMCKYLIGIASALQFSAPTPVWICGLQSTVFLSRLAPTARGAKHVSACDSRAGTWVYQALFSEVVPVPVHKMPPSFRVAIVGLLKIRGGERGCKTVTKPLANSRCFYARPERFKCIQQGLSEPCLGSVMLIVGH